LNQTGLGTLCLLSALGQKATPALGTCLAIASRDAFGFLTISMASASASAVSQFLSTYATSSMTEFFMWTKKSACPAFYDDLSKHALAYRELSLLLRQPPGREAFPGEIFFVHSRLLERSCKPHVSGFITTNMISITDGQIFLSVDLFLANYRPAVDVGLSVTRVGSAAQTSSMKQVGGAFKIDMAQYFELQAFSQFAADIGPETQVRLARGVRLITLLTQDAGNTLSIQQQVQTLCLSNQDSFVVMSTPQLKRLSRPKKICRRIFCRHSYHSCLLCLSWLARHLESCRSGDGSDA
jgi:F-type H+-transporting ATPase subunit alpha